ncbi:uncharacterized protein QYS62_002979 [Fusarium acuminatum]|uniref:Uncharacterized protein n=1 Tax=Fusarium acuminatum TaxID=5515 RepID=A0ABZ2WN90_9HYPO
MLLSKSLVVFIFTIGASEAVPRRDRRGLEDGTLRDLYQGQKAVADDGDMVSEVIGVMGTVSTDYRTMPPGTYTETISTGLVKIIVVNKPTSTTTSRGNCPEECDCTRIKDKESPEYFQCVTNAECIPCRKHEATSTSSEKPNPTDTCPANCDCRSIKDKESQEYFQCLTNAGCKNCRVEGPTI